MMTSENEGFVDNDDNIGHGDNDNDNDNDEDDNDEDEDEDDDNEQLLTHSQQPEQQQQQQQRNRNRNNQQRKGPSRKLQTASLPSSSSSSSPYYSYQFVSSCFLALVLATFALMAWKNSWQGTEYQILSLQQQPQHDQNNDYLSNDDDTSSIIQIGLLGFTITTPVSIPSSSSLLNNYDSKEEEEAEQEEEEILSIPISMKYTIEQERYFNTNTLSSSSSSSSSSSISSWVPNFIIIARCIYFLSLILGLLLINIFLFIPFPIMTSIILVASGSNNDANNDNDNFAIYNPYSNTTTENSKNNYHYYPSSSRKKHLQYRHRHRCHVQWLIGMTMICAVSPMISTSVLYYSSLCQGYSTTTTTATTITKSNEVSNPSGFIQLNYRQWNPPLLPSKEQSLTDEAQDTSTTTSSTSQLRPIHLSSNNNNDNDIQLPIAYATNITVKENIIPLCDVGTGMGSIMTSSLLWLTCTFILLTCFHPGTATGDDDDDDDEESHPNVAYSQLPIQSPTTTTGGTTTTTDTNSTSRIMIEEDHHSSIMVDGPMRTLTFLCILSILWGFALYPFWNTIDGSTDGSTLIGKKAFTPFTSSSSFTSIQYPIQYLGPYTMNPPQNIPYNIETQYNKWIVPTFQWAIQISWIPFIGNYIGLFGLLYGRFCKSSRNSSNSSNSSISSRTLSSSSSSLHSCCSYSCCGYILLSLIYLITGILALSIPGSILMNSKLCPFQDTTTTTTTTSTNSYPEFLFEENLEHYHPFHDDELFLEEDYKDDDDEEESTSIIMMIEMLWKNVIIGDEDSSSSSSSSSNNQSPWKGTTVQSHFGIFTKCWPSGFGQVLIIGGLGMILQSILIWYFLYQLRTIQNQQIDHQMSQERHRCSPQQRKSKQQRLFKTKNSNVYRDNDVEMDTEYETVAVMDNNDDTDDDDDDDNDHHRLYHDKDDDDDDDDDNQEEMLDKKKQDNPLNVLVTKQDTTGLDDLLS